MIKSKFILLLLVCILALPSFAKTNSNAYSTKALKEYESGNYGIAIENANKAIQQNPNNSKAYFVRGLCKSKILESNESQIPKRDIKVTSISQPNVDYSSYIDKIQNKIKLNWHPPKINESKHVILQFEISKNGNLSSIKILESSNSCAMDTAAKKAVEAAAPFPPFPSSFKEDSISIEFSFDYNSLITQSYFTPYMRLPLINIFNLFNHGKI